jgi:hypothetical protein
MHLNRPSNQMHFRICMLALWEITQIYIAGVKVHKDM